MMNAYYNENDAYAAAWLRNLIGARLIAPGEVDERSIRDVEADDLVGFGRAHFFAGIGGWDLALRLAGWPDDRSVWTGSCPCQPFSAAGKRKGTDDERHLWPEFLRLITERSPPNVFGEQVASKDGRGWLAGVRTDLEALGYAVGAADLCAAGAGAPHIRQRLWWVADTVPAGWAERRTISRRGQAAGSGGTGRLADDLRSGLEKRGGHGRVQQEALGSQPGEAVERGGDVGRLEHADRRGPQAGRQAAETAGHGRPVVADGCAGGLGHAESERRDIVGNDYYAAEWPEITAGIGGSSFWSDFDLVPCADGKARRIEPGTFPLAHGVPARVGKLRAYGNAIVPQVAAEFIGAVLDSRP